MTVSSYRCVTIGGHRRRGVRKRSPSAHAAEDVQVEEVHAAKHNKHHAHFPRKRFDPLASVLQVVAELKSQTHVTEVDQIEPNDEQVVDRVGQRLVAVKNIHQKNSAIFVERAGDPHSQGDAYPQVEDVRSNYNVHKGTSLEVFEPVQFAG